MILRVAHRQGCSYEFDHHEHLGRRAGITADGIGRITERDAAGAITTLRIEPDAHCG